MGYPARFLRPSRCQRCSSDSSEAHAACRLDMDQWLVVRDGEHQYQRPSGFEVTVDRAARFDFSGMLVSSEMASEPQLQTSPCARRAPRWRAVSSRRGGRTRSTASIGPPSAVRRRTRRVVGRKRPPEFGDHPSVERETRAGQTPRWFRASRCRVDSGVRQLSRQASGPTRKVPAAGPPTRRPNSGSPSKWGAHIQSIAPSDDTSAAVRVSPMSP